ncbi:MAG TPA: class I SAM-dependent methyltransferase [Dongiaceae bacterium]|nr:class I SAM-dependent methyltransferase [Dongiaceae bacterium]
MDTSSISFTALYTGHVWYKHGMSARFFTSHRGDLMYNAVKPINFVGEHLLGMNLSHMLLQRHRIIDHRISQLIEQEGITQILEIACGLSPRGYKFSRQYPGLHYVEADLPDMASRKQSLLLQHKGFGPHHKVVPCNIFENGAPHGLDYVMTQVLEPGRPTIVVTEGLVNYFDLKTISGFWRRLAELGQQFPAMFYVTDLIPEVAQPGKRVAVNVARNLMGRLTRSHATLHYRNDPAIERGFLDCGFKAVTVHQPEDFYDTLDIPRSPIDSYVRVVEAKCG